MAKTPWTAYQYARHCLKQPWPEGEEAIAKEAEYAFEYALYVVREERWEKGEAAILAEPQWASRYALEVIEGRWPEAEPIIATDPSLEKKYREFLSRPKRPPTETEKNDAYAAYFYAKDVSKDRFHEGEAVIAAVPSMAAAYAGVVLRSRWPEVEAVIATDPWAAFLYAETAVRGPWREGEAVMGGDAQVALKYAREILKGPFAAGEAAIARNPTYAFEYARDVKKGRFLEGEPAIASAKGPEAINLHRYQTRVLDAFGLAEKSEGWLGDALAKVRAARPIKRPDALEQVERRHTGQEGGSPAWVPSV